MPLFEVDAERPVLVHPTPTTKGFGTAAQRVVDGNLDGLLGEQIFPVAQGRSDDEPHLLALDAAGLPVVIDVVSELTEETLTRALNHAGAAGQLNRSELAARYPRGAGAFHEDIAAFNDNVPITRPHGARTTGARLIVICQDAADGVLDALDFLRQPGSPVAVLRLAVVKTADGRRFVDVSPLAVSREHRPVARATAQLADSPDFVEGVAVGRALTGKVSVVTRQPRGGTREEAPSTPAVPTASAPPSDETIPRRSLRSRAERRQAQEEPQSTTYRVAATSQVETGQLPPIDENDPLGGRGDAATVSGAHAAGADPFPVPVPAPVAAPGPEAGSTPLSTPPERSFGRANLRLSGAIPETFDQTVPSSRHATGSPATVDGPAVESIPSTHAAPARPVASRSASHATRADLGAPAAPVVEGPSSEGPWIPEAGPAPVTLPDLSGDNLGEEDDPDLIALAQSIGAPSTLVWSRPRRGQRYEATLLPDGYIVLVDGSRFRHPDLAAIAVSGTQSADGWTVWRFGDDGPTLADAFRARYS